MATPMTHRQIKDAIISKIGTATWRKISHSIKFPPKSLWATNRTRDFAEEMILLTLYKDIFAVSYSELLTMVQPRLKLAKESIQHNVKSTRKELRKWAKTIIVPDDSSCLSCVAASLDRPKPCDKVTLWIDSSDFRAKGKQSIHKDKSNWSHKLHSPGRRWLTIMNGKGAPQWISEFHKPTDYDGDLIIFYAKVIDEKFKGETMIGDNHFKKAVDFLHKVTLISPRLNAGRHQVIDGKKVPRKLPEADQQHNSVISGVRGKVEAPYGWVKSQFYCLSQPFYEDANQHDCVIWTAFAVHRLMIS